MSVPAFVVGAVLFVTTILGVAVASLVVMGAGMEASATTSSCGAPAGAQTDIEAADLSEEQLDNAATIANVATGYGLSPQDTRRAQIIGIATAMQESTLNNIDYGDRDSLGLFQQRPSQGWGTPAQVTDPVYAAGKFYDGLVEVSGWQQLPVTVAAQRVQRSAFPDAYAKWEAMATEVTDSLARERQAAQNNFANGEIPGTPGLQSTPVATCGAAVPTVGADPTIQSQPAGKSSDGKNSQRAVYAKEKILAVFGCDTGRQPCVKSIGGQANRNDGGKSDHNRGLALDVMIGSGCVLPDSPENKLGDEVKAWVDANAGPLNVTYVIWEDNISYPNDPGRKAKSQGKLQKGGGAGNCTYAHQDHPHISFKAD